MEKYLIKSNHVIVGEIYFDIENTEINSQITYKRIINNEVCHITLIIDEKNNYQCKCSLTNKGKTTKYIIEKNQNI